MPRYRKRPVMIDAFCLGVDPIPDWFMDKVSANQIVLHGAYGQLDQCQIHTLEGVMTAQHGDYILRGVAGEIYPCKAEIFTQTYVAESEET